MAINGIIVVEVLSGISKEGEYKKVESDFSGFHYLSLFEEDFFETSSFGSTLRRKGVTVPSTDLIIAMSAIRTENTLYHLDSHFGLIAKHTHLKSRNISRL